MAKLTVQNTQITILQWERQDYISLTDMASAKEVDNRSTDIIKIGLETVILLNSLEDGR